MSVRDEGQGPAVVLVHGYPLGAWMWEAQVRTLAAAGFRALAPDLRGFGDAPPPPEGVPWSIDAYADDVAASLRDRDVERAAVVGFSMGGYVALSLAERRPDLVAALVLSNTRAGPDGEEARKGREAAAETARREGAGPIADTMAKKLFAPATLRDRPELVAGARERMARTPPAGIVTALLAMRDRPDRRPALPRVRVPALVIAGGEDALMPLAEAEAMRAAIPGAEMVTIPGTGHASNLEAPEPYGRALIDFLSRPLRQRGAARQA